MARQQRSEAVVGGANEPLELALARARAEGREALEKLAAEVARLSAENRAREAEIAVLHQRAVPPVESDEPVHSPISDEGQWLLQLARANMTTRRWWGWLPPAMRRQRERRRLARLGLFDGEAYLRRHRDVAATGIDPLYHYLVFGLVEGRQR